MAVSCDTLAAQPRSQLGFLAGHSETKQDGTLNLVINAPGLKLGGGNRHLQPFLNALSHRLPTWRLHAYVSPGVSRVLETVPLAQVSEVRAVSAMSRLAWDAYGLPSRVVRLKPDCLVSISNFGPAVRLGVPSILFQRNSYYFDKSWVAQLPRKSRSREFLRRNLALQEMGAADAIVTPSEAMAKYIQSWRRSPPSSRFRTIPHGVDTGRFSFRPRNLATLCDLRILLVGHAAPHRGFKTAVRLLRRLVEVGCHPTLALTIERDDASLHGAHAHAAIELAGQLGVADRIDFVGATSTPEHLYHAADVALIASHTESFCFPAAEAMACGTPVLASDLPAIRELAGDTAAYFSPGDDEGAFLSLTGLLNLPVDVATIRLARARRIAEALTWDRSADGVASLVERLVAHGKNPST